MIFASLGYKLKIGVCIMDQQEYIDVSDRIRVSNARQILSEIVPEQSSVITPSELQHVLTTLRYWEEKLLHQIKISH